MKGLFSISIAVLYLLLPQKVWSDYVVFVRGEVVNIRSGPGTQYEKKTHVKRGDRLVVIDKDEEWLKIHLPDGNEGWIAQQLTNKWPKKTRSVFEYISMKKWMGKKFVFLPMRKYDQKSGYRYFKGGGGMHGFPTYKECVGKTATVIGVTRGEFFTTLKFKVSEIGKIYTCPVSDEGIGGIALLADIENAKKQWVGRTLWYVKNTIDVYDRDTDATDTISLEPCSPVKVIDIVTGWDNNRPVRFILQTPTGKDGYVDLNLSGTNSSFQEDHRFEDYFIEQDPRKSWRAGVWSAIEKKQVVVGMNKIQAQLVLGEPRSTRTLPGNNDYERWIYGGVDYLYLHFEYGVITRIEKFPGRFLKKWPQ